MIFVAALKLRVEQPVTNLLHFEQIFGFLKGAALASKRRTGRGIEHYQITSYKMNSHEKNQIGCTNRKNIKNVEVKSGKGASMRNIGHRALELRTVLQKLN